MAGAIRELFVDIGFKINPSGLTEADAKTDYFKENLLGTTIAADNLGFAVSGVGSAASQAMDEAGKKTEELGGWWGQHQKSIEGAGNALKEYRGILAGIAGVSGGIVGTSVKVAADFEAAMSKVGAVSRALPADMERLTATARELGATTAFSASQAAEGMSYLAMAGFSTEETIAAMPGLLDTAAAAGTDLGRSADIVSNILSGFNIEASETGRIADVLTATFTSSNTSLETLGESMKMVAPVSASLGVGIEETAALVGKLGDAGIQGTMAGTALRTLMLSLSAPVGEAAKQLDELGIQTVDTAGNMLPLTGILGDIADKTTHMGDAQRAAFLEQLVGRQGVSAMSALLSVGADSLDEYTGKLRNSGGVAAEVADKQMDNFKGAMTELGSAVEGAQISLGSAFVPALRLGAKALTKMVGAFNSLPGPVKTTIAVGLGAVAAVSGLTLAASFLIPQIGLVVKAFGAFRTILSATRTASIVTGIVMSKAFLPVTLAIGGLVVAGLIFQDVLTFLRGDGDSLIGRVLEWTQGLGVFGSILRGMIFIVIAPFMALIDVFRFVTGESGTATEGVINWFRTLPGRMMEIFGNLWEGLKGWFLALPARTIGMLAGWWDSLKTWFIETVDFGSILSDALGKAVGALPGPLKSIGEKVMGYFPQSPAKEGPLTGLDRVGEGFIGELAGGFEAANLGELDAAVGEVALASMPGLSGRGGAGGGMGAPSFQVTVQVDARGAADAERVGEATAERVREVLEDWVREAFHSVAVEAI